jgi:hypothetical protein
MWARAILGILGASAIGLLAACQQSSPVEQVATTTPSGGGAPTALVRQTPTQKVIANSPTTTPAVPVTVTSRSEVPDVVGPDAVWAPSDDGKPAFPCYQDQACIYRYMLDNGASPAAIRFFLQHNAFLYKLWDLGKVDLALIRWPWWADISGYDWLLVNGTPEVRPSPYETYLPLEGLPPLAGHEVLEAYGTIAKAPEFDRPGVQWWDGAVESATVGPEGRQTFVFEYRITPCDACDTGYRYRVRVDFTPAGVLEGTYLEPPCALEPLSTSEHLTPVPGLAPPCPPPFAEATTTSASQ